MSVEQAEQSKQFKPTESRAELRTDRTYVFVADGMNIGGIETLLVRMANRIADLGYRVIVVAQDGPCMRSISEKVSIYKAAPSEAGFAKLRTVPLDDICEGTKVYVWTTSPYSLISIYKIQRELSRRKGIKSVSVSGVFGPARAVHGLKSRWNMIKHLLVLGWLPRKSVYFMSEAVKNTYVEHFGARFSKWEIHKLTLDEPRLIWQPQRSGALRILSIGRITNLKPYNFGALDVAEFMSRKGIPIHWDIWGHGDESDLLQQAIRDRGLSLSVTFHGELPYSQFSQVALESDLFVGMGTAALEAAQLGVPTIVALAWSRLGTYGFLHECPIDSIGEQYSGIKEKDLLDVIYSYSNYPEEQRVEIGLRCRESVLLKTSGEPAPFDAIFEGGIMYPSRSTVALRMITFGAAQNAWNLMKRVMIFGKSISQLAPKHD